MCPDCRTIMWKFEHLHNIQYKYCNCNLFCTRIFPRSFGSCFSVCMYYIFSLCPPAGYPKSRQAVANFYSCPEAPLEAEVLTLNTPHTFADTLFLSHLSQWLYSKNWNGWVLVVTYMYGFGVHALESKVHPPSFPGCDFDQRLQSGHWPGYQCPL